jgi:choline dehydrogenase-like flavoprotein
VPQHSDEGVALEACEFWAAFCEHILADGDAGALTKEMLRPVLPHLVPLLLKNMVFEEYDDEVSRWACDVVPPESNVAGGARMGDGGTPSSPLKYWDALLLKAMFVCDGQPQVCVYVVLPQVMVLQGRYVEVSSCTCGRDAYRGA